MNGRPRRAGRLPATPPSARTIAAAVVQRVLGDRAYLSPVLDAELLRHPQLDARERALAAELSYGSVRTYGYLMQRLGRHAKKKLPSGDAVLLAELLVAAYQILLLDRVPASAAVNAAVSSVKQKRGARVAGFANALLRNLSRDERAQTRSGAVLESVPAFLARRLEQQFGAEEMALLVGATETPPPLVARLVAGQTLPEPRAHETPCRLAPGAFLLSAPLTPEERRGPAWVVQEEGAQLIARALGARPGEQVLDACAGRGAKASLLFETMQKQGVLWAVDAHPNKLDSLEREFRRIGMPIPELCCVDWTRGQGTVPGGFQRALVDAPCTGSGTLRRRPELLLRFERDDPARMAQLQEAIVRSVATRLAPGGRLVYAICSVLIEECEQVVARVSDILEPVAFDVPLIAALDPAGRGQLRLLPGTHGTDGYFLASLRSK